MKTVIEINEDERVLEMTFYWLLKNGKIENIKGDVSYYWKLDEKDMPDGIIECIERSNGTIWANLFKEIWTNKV